MKIITRTLAVLAFAGWVGNASAVPIGAADIVTRGGQEWAQVDLFTGFSWNEMNAQCPGGVCTATAQLNSWDLDGWSWATVDEVQALFNSFTGQATVAPGSYVEFGALWALEFISFFDATFSNVESANVYGWSSTGVDATLARRPYIEDYHLAQFSEQTATTTSQDLKTTTWDYVGGWFVRDAN